MAENVERMLLDVSNLTTMLSNSIRNLGTDAYTMANWTAAVSAAVEKFGGSTLDTAKTIVDIETSLVAKTDVAFGLVSKSALSYWEQLEQAARVYAEIRKGGNEEEAALLSAYAEQMLAKRKDAEQKNADIVAMATGDVGGTIQAMWHKTIDMAQSEWLKLVGISEAAWTALEAGFGVVAFVLVELWRIFMIGKEVALEQIKAQLAMVSAGGLANMGMFDLTFAMGRMALDATVLQLKFTDVTAAFDQLARNAVMGTNEIGRMAGTFDIASPVFAAARSTMAVTLADLSAQLVALAPAFGVSTTQMVDMATKMRTQLNVPLEQITLSFGKLYAVASETGFTVDELFNAMTQAGTQLRWVGVGADQITANFLVLGTAIRELGGPLDVVTSNSRMTAEMISNLSKAMMDLPVEQVTAMIMAAHPGMPTTEAIREAYAADPIQRLFLESQFFLQNIQGTSAEVATMLAVGLPELRAFGTQAMPMADTIVRLGPHLAALSTMGVEQQREHLSRIDASLVSELDKLTTAQRLISQSPLEAILQLVKNIETTLTTFFGLPLWRILVGVPAAAATGMGRAIGVVPGTTPDIYSPIGGR